MLDISRSAQKSIIHTKPNRSANWRINLFILLFMFCVTSCVNIASIFFLDLWILIPFYIIDLIIIFFGLYFAYTGCFAYETIKINENSITIESKYYNKEVEKQVINTGWAFFKIVKRFKAENNTIFAKYNYIDKLYICTHNLTFLIGKFATHQEKKKVANELKHYLQQKT